MGTFKYQSTHKQWTYRQTVSTIGCIAFAGITLFVKRKLGNLYVFSIDKFPRNIKDPQKYRANFYGGKSIEFYSNNVYLAPENELGPFTSFLISGQKVFVNSADMHYYEYKEMLQDAVKPKIEDISTTSDLEFKELIGEMEKLKKKQQK